MVLSLASHRRAFVHAIDGATFATLMLTAALHLGSVLARSEAWMVSVRAAGGKLGRRGSYQIASLGFAANVLSSSRIVSHRQPFCPSADKAPTRAGVFVRALSQPALADKFDEEGRWERPAESCQSRYRIEASMR